jgi:uncharacterized protein YukE
VTERWAAAERRWSEAADLLRSAGRAPGDLREWLGHGWTGRAADSFSEWSQSFEEASRRASGALSDAAAAAGMQAGAGPTGTSGAGPTGTSGGGLGPGHLERLEDAARAMREVSVPGQRSAPKPSRPAAERPRVPAQRTTAHPRGRQPPARVRQWIDEAVQILREEGYRADQTDPRALATIIHHESGGNPSAVNNGDSNAARGNPSTGLMQTIPSTFRHYALPGHTDILDPVDNIVAGARYAIERYGSVSRVPGVVSLGSGHGYRGY